MKRKPKFKLYYSSFIPVYRSNCILLITCMIGSSLLSGNISVISILNLIAGAMIISLFMTQISILCFPVGINSIGIRSSTYQMFHWHHTIAWHDIQQVKSQNIIGLRHLIASDSKNHQIYVPLYLSKQRQFEQELKDLSGDSNPLAKAL